MQHWKEHVDRAVWKIFGSLFLSKLKQLCGSFEEQGGAKQKTLFSLAVRNMPRESKHLALALNQAEQP